MLALNNAMSENGHTISAGPDGERAKEKAERVFNECFMGALIANEKLRRVSGMAISSIA